MPQRAGALLEEVVETPCADDIDEHVVHLGALRDGHLGLRDGAIAGEIDGVGAEEVQDAHTLVEAGAAHLDELLRRALEPGRHHAPVGVPDGAEPLPVAGIAPHHPVLDDLADRQPLQHFGMHLKAPLRGA